jgi:hypothetical protein
MHSSYLHWIIPMNTIPPLEINPSSKSEYYVITLGSFDLSTRLVLRIHFPHKFICPYLPDPIQEPPFLRIVLFLVISNRHTLQFMRLVIEDLLIGSLLREILHAVGGDVKGRVRGEVVPV